MNRCQPYCQMNPLTGIWPAYENAISYRYVSPDGDEGRNNQHLGAHYVSATMPPRCNGATITLHSPFLILNWSHTFSAKERDSETGLSYFGSRYYSSDLSIWLSVDPMSDKYPSLSPYVYCANNPVKLVDPNGEKFRLIGRNANVAFRNYLISHKGVDCINMYEAFSLSDADPNMIMFKDYNITYKQFSSQYHKVTGERMNNKDAKKLFKAIKSDVFIEVNLISKKSIPEDCLNDVYGFEFLLGISNFTDKPLSDNPALAPLMIDINSVNFNEIFSFCAANIETSDSKFFYNTTGNKAMMNPPVGFMLVNARDKSTEQAQESLIKEILDFYNSVK